MARPATFPDNNLVCVIACDDDYFLGVLQSRTHELWSRRLVPDSEKQKADSDTPNTTTFETFPFPWPPGREPAGDAHVEAIAQAARELVEQRDVWLNLPDLRATRSCRSAPSPTSTTNALPGLTWRTAELDEAVMDAYGWPHAWSDQEILARLLALNLARAGSNRELDFVSAQSSRLLDAGLRLTRSHQHI